MSHNNKDGQANLSTVNGSTYVGRYATDGSTNVVINDGSTYTGINHKSGAMNAVINETAKQSNHANGSLLIKTKIDASGYTVAAGR